MREAPDNNQPVPGRAESLWLANRASPSFPALEEDQSVDVAIVGAGITGLSAGLALAEAGKRVAIVEQRQVAGGETGHTTAHMTEVLDTPYRTLVSRFGQESAQLVAESSRAAIDMCEEWISAYHIECGFERLPAFLYTEDPREPAVLQDEGATMAGLGCRTAWTDKVPLPFRTAGGIRVERQAQMDPYRYCLGLASALTSAGGQIFESTRVTGIEEGEPCVVLTQNGATLRAAAVVAASHVPINNRVLLHTKLAAYRTYVLAARVDAALSATFFDTARPYHYLRTCTLDHATYLIVGGEDHRTGVVEEGKGALSRLAKYLDNHFPAAASKLEYRWSGQIIEPVDGLPYIGHNSFQSRIFVATGYAGNGITFGTLAGTILCDSILGRSNRFADVYDATRLPTVGTLGTFIRENAVLPVALARDHLTNAHVVDGPAKSVARGEGKVLLIGGVKIAVSRDEQGELQAVSAVCPHLGCSVQWNDVEKSWDCPCHGSRFSRDGQVLNGPALAPLAPMDLNEDG